MNIPRTILLSLVGTGLLCACNDAPAPSSAALTPQARATTTPIYLHPGKIMASNCFQCHGTYGRNGPFVSLAGRSATSLYGLMKNMQTSTREGQAIMKVHANAYSDAQLQSIADFFSKVP